MKMRIQKQTTIKATEYFFGAEKNTSMYRDVYGAIKNKTPFFSLD